MFAILSFAGLLGTIIYNDHKEEKERERKRKKEKKGYHTKKEDVMKKN